MTYITHQLKVGGAGKRGETVAKRDLLPLWLATFDFDRTVQRGSVCERGASQWKQNVKIIIVEPNDA